MNKLKNKKTGESRLERLLVQISLRKIRNSLMFEEDKDYYSDIDNIEERYEIGRKNHFEHGYEWIEIDYLICWKNGYFTFSKMNRSNLKGVSKNSCKKLTLCR